MIYVSVVINNFPPYVNEYSDERKGTCLLKVWNWLPHMTIYCSVVVC